MNGLGIQNKYIEFAEFQDCFSKDIYKSLVNFNEHVQCYFVFDLLITIWDLKGITEKTFRETIFVIRETIEAWEPSMLLHYSDFNKHVVTKPILKLLEDALPFYVRSGITKMAFVSKGVQKNPNVINLLMNIPGLYFAMFGDVDYALTWLLYND